MEKKKYSNSNRVIYLYCTAFGLGLPKAHDKAIISVGTQTGTEMFSACDTKCWSTTGRQQLQLCLQPTVLPSKCDVDIEDTPYFRYVLQLFALPAKYVEQGLCNCQASIRPSVRLSHPAAARRGCGFAAVGPAARRYRSIAARPALSSSRSAAA